MFRLATKENIADEEQVISRIPYNGTLWTADDEAEAGLREGCEQQVRTIAALASMSLMWTTLPESTKYR
jgi:hypothetical protein